MLTVPLQAVPSQTLAISLDGQPCKIDVVTRGDGLFVNLYVNDALIIAGVAARNRVRVVIDAYLGFIGDLSWLDTEGDEDPTYDGLGSRWQLVYI
ncbi:MAG: hypothetical protein EBR82_11255 [Caulobacteraceae bacterium]|nr:hypothetical protein [Caulobacteraceae bacterium]